MTNLIICLLPLALLTGCSPTPAEPALTDNPLPLAEEVYVPPILPEEYGILLRPDTTVSYASARGEFKRLRAELRHEMVAPDSLSFVFTEALLNGIIPYWYGTPWSFEGHTARPGVGEIACGYFVSTTLAHLGLNVNRYRLAQRSPLREAESLALGTEIIEVNAPVTTDVIHQVDSLTTEGIYFIGFNQSHVGFLLKRSGELFLLHSDYSSAFGVKVEPIGESVTFGLFERFYLAPLSGNRALLQRWISGEEVVVVAE